MSDEPKKLVNAEYVMATLGVSRATAYRIIRELNRELRGAGVRTIDGRVDRDYLLAVFFSPGGKVGKEAIDGR